MNAKQQRITIAEACGWKQPQMAAEMNTQINQLIANSTGQHANYAGCLNAMHKAEKVLTAEQQRAYGMLLHSMLVEEMRDNGCVTQEQREENPRWVWHATAAQRAEAFLRTLNLWKDQ